MRSLVPLACLALALVALPPLAVADHDPVCFTGADGSVHCCPWPLPDCPLGADCPAPAFLSCVAHALADGLP